MRRAAERAGLSTIGVCAFFVALAVPAATFAGATAAQWDVAEHFAPVIRQGLDDQWERDFLLAFDFDGDWVGNNNKDSVEVLNTLPVSSRKAYAYFAASESATHYFVTYGFFHAHDYKTLPNHENDMEGFAVVIEKDGSAYGTPVAAFTHEHGSNDVRAWSSIPEKEGDRAIVYVEEKGHGVWFTPADNRWDGTDIEYRWMPAAQVPAVRLDGCAYYPANPAYPDGPSVYECHDADDWQTGSAAGNGRYDQDADGRGYALLDFGDTIWGQRSNPSTFASTTGDSYAGKAIPTSFKGDDGNQANPPWNWAAENDVAFFNPAKFFDDKLSALSGITRIYSDHLYRTDIGLSLDGTNDSGGGGCSTLGARTAGKGLASALFFYLLPPAIAAAWLKRRKS